MPPKPARAPRPPTRATSRSGGAATHAGNQYEIVYAIREVLVLIGQELKKPQLPLAVRLQPRTSGTAWDIGFEPGERRLEVKSQPTRQDVEEWLDRTALAGATIRSELAFGHSTGFLVQVGTLIRLTHEAADDVEFSALMAQETLPDAADLLARLGTNHRAQLARMKVHYFPEGALGEVEAITPAYAGGDASRLYAFLYTRLSRAAAARERLEIRVLMQEIAADGIRLVEPPWTADDLPPLERRVLCVLQALVAPLPGDLITPLFSVDESVVADMVARALVLKDSSGYKMPPVGTPLMHEGEADILARALEALKRYLPSAPRAAVASQAGNLLALMRKAASTDSQLVARVFWDLDKTLKEGGRKRDVLLIARQSIAAARCVSRTEEHVKSEAAALLCGTSWVYQRMNRLSEARADAEKSHALGESFGWKRNTAYYYKCVGRLARMQAEQAPRGEERARLLRESEDFLLKSIALFPEVDELNQTRRDAEIGEARGLLARTYFVMGDDRKTVEALDAASAIVVRGSKAWIDVEILEVERLLRTKEFGAAERRASDVLASMPKDGREVTEMRARLLEVHAGALLRTNQSAAAQRALEDAAQIWERLGELYSKAKAKWKARIAFGALDPADRAELERLGDFRVRVRAVELHEQALAAASRGAAGRRTGQGMGAPYWLQLTAKARAEVALEGDPWD